MRVFTVAALPFALVAALAAAPGAGSPPIDSGEVATLADAIGKAEAGDWAGAADLAGRTGEPVGSDIVLWIRLRDGVGDWSEYKGFLARNPAWPSLGLMRRHAERSMPADLPATVVLGFFQDEPPLTGTGAFRYAAGLAALGREAAAEAEILRAWREMSMALGEQDTIAARHPDLIAAHHVARLDMLLWRGSTAEAAAMLPRVPADWRALAEARIAVRTGADGSTALIDALPNSVNADPGLAYERYVYRVGKGRWDEAEAFLLERSTSAEALGRPDMWMERRANLARQALRRGDVAAAYALAARNFGGPDSGADYADAEWVAGFVALTRMDDPRAAAGHFERFRAAVTTPISLGRAGYWLGLAHERAGDAAAANAAYRAGAQHQTSFYGQLAAERVGVAPDPRLAGEVSAPDWRGQPFLRSPVVLAAQLLAAAGDDARAVQFLRHAAESLPPPQRAALAQMAIDLGRPHLGVRIAKDAAADGVLLPSQYYPLHDMADRRWPVPKEFALAIARQESEFNPDAVSSAGARGLMQLMPATAREVSVKLGIGYDADRLTGDPMYNARLGTAYLRRMLDAYRGSYILAAASYNAGPGRVREWIGAFGDPRAPDADAVQWIETIPFEETRNYVMRVLESLHVYRARLDGETPPIRLASDIGAAS